MVSCQVAAGAASDLAGNSGPASNILSITYDSVAPTCTVTGPASPLKTSPITFTMTFSESVTGLSTADITVTNGTKGTLSGSGTTYTIPVTPSGQGAVTCLVIAGAASDTAGNNNLISNTLSIVYDSVGPTGTVSGTTPTNNIPILFTITFNEPASGLTTGGITLTNGTMGALSGSGAGPYTLTVTPTALGAVTCKVNAGAVVDALGNSGGVSNTMSITYDTVGPTCTVTGPASPTKNNPATFTINFNESVTGLTAASINVTNGTKGTLSGSGSGPYTLPVTPAGQGAVSCQVPAGAASDLAGNSGSASNILSVTYDSVAPTCTVTAPPSPTWSSPVIYTAIFSEPVTGLASGDITAGGGSVGTITGSGTGPYSIPITPSVQGTVTCQVKASAATDSAGNGNTISNVASVTAFGRNRFVICDVLQRRY